MKILRALVGRVVYNRARRALERAERAHMGVIWARVMRDPGRAMELERKMHAERARARELAELSAKIVGVDLSGTVGV